eukprot:c27610_g1_i2 orf=283-2313(+)
METETQDYIDLRFDSVPDEEVGIGAEGKGEEVVEAVDVDSGDEENCEAVDEVAGDVVEEGEAEASDARYMEEDNGAVLDDHSAELRTEDGGINKYVPDGMENMNAVENNREGHPKEEVWEDDAFHVRTQGNYTLGGRDGDAVGTPENRRLSLKRPRHTYWDDNPFVRVAYRNLTSESKKKLKELLREWAEWHGKSIGDSRECKKENLESGDEEYFPALQVGEESNLTMHFWMDKPSKQAQYDEHSLGEIKVSGSQEEGEVPMYDRACTTTLVSEETTSSLDGCWELPEEVSRCFNCGSYSHSLKDCPRPRDNAAINNARKILSQKRGVSSGPRATSRYYQSSPGGKFDDLKPGVLGSETRQSLGIGALDPPPWLNRMRELGYPPGYIDEPDEPSGITIFGTHDSADGGYLGEDGEITGNRGFMEKCSTASQTMTVEFPGLNAPIPEKANKRLWAARTYPSVYAPVAETSVQKTAGRKTVSVSRYSATAVTADGVEHSGSTDYNSVCESLGPGYESFAKNPHVRSSPNDGSIPKYSGEKKNSGVRSGKVNEKVTVTGKAQLGRSVSDSGRSPQFAYDDARPLLPLSGHGLPSRQGGLMQSPQSYHSPQSGRMLSPQTYHSPQSGVQSMRSPSWRTPYGRDLRDELTETRRQAWLQAHDCMDSLPQSERFERPASWHR